MPNPGTEVPGYFLCVPTGRKMAKRHRPEENNPEKLNSQIWTMLGKAMRLKTRCEVTNREVASRQERKMDKFQRLE